MRKPLLYRLLKTFVAWPETSVEDEALRAFSLASPKIRALMLLGINRQALWEELQAQGVDISYEVLDAACAKTRFDSPSPHQVECCCCEKIGPWRGLVVSLNEERVELFFCFFCENRKDVIEGSTPGFMMNREGKDGYFTKSFLGYMLTYGGSHSQTYNIYIEKEPQL